MNSGRRPTASNLGIVARFQPITLRENREVKSWER